MPRDELISTYLRAVLNGKRDQFARTPEVLLKIIRELMGVKRKTSLFDPCPADPQFDGLAVSWRAMNYVNPPFVDAAIWARKAVAESRSIRGCITAFLIPLRPETRYTHVDILPHSVMAIIWLQRVCFPPFTRPLPEPIATYLIAPKPRDSHSVAPEERVHMAARLVSDISKRRDDGILQFHKCVMRAWDIGPSSAKHTDAYDARLMPRLRAAYGPLDHEDHSCRGRFAPPPTSRRHSHHNSPQRTYECVLGSPRDALARAEETCSMNPNNIVVLLTLPPFGHAYMERYAPLIREIVMLRPTIGFQGGSSLVGSVLLVLGQKKITSASVQAENARGPGVPCVFIGLDQRDDASASPRRRRIHLCDKN